MGDVTDATPALLARWHTGDERALATLVELHLPWLQQHLEHRLGEFLRRQAEPGDFVQDAVADFLRYAPRFQVRDARQLRGLLARVVENTLRDKNDWFRAQRRDLGRNTPLPTDTVLSLDPALQPGTTPSGAAMRSEARDWVRLGLELLSAEDRKVLVAREYEDRSFLDIGKQLGLDANAARMRWVRAVARLADLLRRLRRGELPEARQ
ncbi:MAG: sigma-70 family RNA polymerase sigma factor [Planctomycetes bacterium]|nr:sigma-70 family RNA polymerase sigma factor [Planctomycetota bacterium]